MALDFGKLNFSVSFNPTSAFPLDARCYFESYESAVQAAQSACEVGSADSVYYYGQTLIVVENNKARFYIIQPDGSLSEIACTSDGITVNPKLFEFDAYGNLSLKGFDTAALSSVLAVGPEGTIIWSEVYTKKQTDDKIAAAVTAAAHLKRKIVASKDDIDINAKNAEHYIYMVPSGYSDSANKYVEYMVLVIEQNGQELRTLEQVGSWSVDLSDYITSDAVAGLLNTKVDKVEGSRLMTNAEGEKLAKLTPSLITQVNEAQFAVVDGQLDLVGVTIAEVKDLSDILNKGKETDGGYTLVTTEERQKINKLVINSEDGSLEIGAAQVSNLAQWITEHSTEDNFVSGLSQHSLTDERLAKLNKAITSEFINSVGPEFTVTNKKLSLDKISMTQVTDLTEVLAEKVENDEFLILAATVEGNTANIQALRERLTWSKLF